MGAANYLPCLFGFKGAVVAAVTTKSHSKTATLKGGSSEFIRITSRERTKKAPVGRLDHSYTHGSDTAENVTGSSTTGYITTFNATVCTEPDNTDEKAGCEGTLKHVIVSAACKADNGSNDIMELPNAYLIKTETVEADVVAEGVIHESDSVAHSSTSTLQENDEKIDQKGRYGRAGISGNRKEKVIHICDCGRSFLKSKEFSEHRRSHTEIGRAHV